MAEWISVEDELPEWGWEVLCIEMADGPDWVPEPQITVGYMTGSGKWITVSSQLRELQGISSRRFSHAKVTHWQELPDLPEEVQA
ncbi:MAG: DUF551 domain-containing protein [Elusimicrobiales bacterium]|nr:DUF551 domain-containing protein [Elusimicrobiales bacterium]